MKFGAVIDPPDGPATPEQIRAYTQRLTDEIAAFVQQHPDQWFWVHRRWKGAAAVHSDQENK